MSNSANVAITALLYKETGTDSVKMTIGTSQQYESRLAPDDTMIRRNEDYRSVIVAPEVRGCIIGMKFAKRCKPAPQNENVGVRGIPKATRARGNYKKTESPVLPAT
jgi:hypothetical protein